jgi:hypothetical protein
MGEQNSGKRRIAAAPERETRFVRRGDPRRPHPRNTVAREDFVVQKHFYLPGLKCCALAFGETLRKCRQLPRRCRPGPLDGPMTRKSSQP